MNATTRLDGQLPPGSPLAVRRSLAQLPGYIQPLALYAVEEQWERDTRRLPGVLGRARRRVRAFAERELVPRAAAFDLAAHPSPGEVSPDVQEILRLAGRAGLLTDQLPWPLGSAPASSARYPLVWYQVLRVEELARACGGLMLLLSAHGLGVAPLVFAGDLGVLRRFLLPAFRATRRGDPQLFAYAITEPGTGSDWVGTPLVKEHHPGVIARPVDGGWSLSGRKIFISGGDVARYICVFAVLAREGAESLTCFLVSPGMPGFRVARTELKMGMRASGAAELEFDNVVVPRERIIGGLRRGWALHRATMNISRIPVAAMGVGFAQAATEAAIGFACRVRLANKELVHYQEVQLALADMIAATTAIRALVWSVARASYAPRDAEAGICKFYATDVALDVCERAMDLAGNHGMLYGERIEKIYRDARLTQIFEGTNQINRLAVIGDRQEQLLAEIVRQRATG